MTVVAVSSLLGGIGLFLLGMILMTDGLKSLAGDALKTQLSRFTGGRFTAVLSGAALTALVQSSHATIISTIGFVSAGLLTLNQAIGIVMGAHVGTTVTGWLVSLLGLKLRIGIVAMPLIGLGAALRILGKERVSNAGTFIAGFGLIFVGIDALQSGMTVFSASIDLTGFPATDIFGRLVVIAAGILLTLVMQSSSAALAATLTAFNAAAITLDQGAAMIIGCNIGTTLTAAAAAIGASVPAKRTALVHILFNVVTGIIVFISFPLFLGGVVRAAHFVSVLDGTIILAAFHTAFNIFGVMILFPLVPVVITLLERLVPERGDDPARHLDSTVIRIPSVAVEAARLTVTEIAVSLLGAIGTMIEARRATGETGKILDRALDSLEKTRLFLSNVTTQRESSRTYQKGLIDVLHAMDHMDQLIIACREFENPQAPPKDHGHDSLHRAVTDNYNSVMEWLKTIAAKAPLDEIEETSQNMRDLRLNHRALVMRLTADGEVDPNTALHQIEALRWLERISYRIWRALFYLGYYEPSRRVNGRNNHRRE